MHIAFQRLGALAFAVAATLALSPNPALADCQMGNCWGAVAAGLYEFGDGTSRVSIGSAINLGSPNEAGWAAINKCQENGISCEVVGSAFQGCGYITSGKGNGNGSVAWGAGSTAQEAYDNCMAYGGVVCDTHTIGGCNSN